MAQADSQLPYRGRRVDRRTPQWRLRPQQLAADVGLTRELEGRGAPHLRARLPGRWVGFSFGHRVDTGVPDAVEGSTRGCFCAAWWVKQSSESLRRPGVPRNWPPRTCGRREPDA